MRQLIGGSQYYLYRGASLRGPFRDRPRPRPGIETNYARVYTAHTYVPRKDSLMHGAGVRGATRLTSLFFSYLCGREQPLGNRSLVRAVS